LQVHLRERCTDHGPDRDLGSSSRVTIFNCLQSQKKENIKHLKNVRGCGGYAMSNILCRVNSFRTSLLQWHAQLLQKRIGHLFKHPESLRLFSTAEGFLGVTKIFNENVASHGRGVDCLNLDINVLPHSTAENRQHRAIRG
jgi:hypothetical protein